MPLKEVTIIANIIELWQTTDLPYQLQVTITLNIKTKMPSHRYSLSAKPIL